MSAEAQLQIWAVPFNEQQHLWQEMFILKKKHEVLRRGSFQRHEDLKKEVELLRDELAYLKERKHEKPIILTA